MRDVVGNGTSAEVVAGRILVRPSFADLLRIRRIPGGSWDTRIKAYAFPASRECASILKNYLRALCTSEQFNALLISGAQPFAGDPRPSSEAADFAGTAPDPLAAPAEIAAPDGLITQPWRHQEAAYKFCLDKFALGFRAILLAMGMGTGKTLVAIMLLLFLRARRVMIASPLRVVPVWVTQIERHVGINIVTVALDEDAGAVEKKRGLAEEKLRLAHARGVPFICIINYDSAWREPFASWAESWIGT